MVRLTSYNYQRCLSSFASLIDFFDFVYSYFLEYNKENETCIEDETDYIGRTINKCSETITNNWEECQQLCQDNPFCNFFVWMKPSHKMKNQCCLKDKIQRKINRRGLKSGPKFCLGKNRIEFLSLYVRTQ